MQADGEVGATCDMVPLRVLITSRSLDFPGGVANYVQALVEHSDNELVSFSHIPISQASVASAGWRRPFEYLGSVARFTKAVLEVRPDLIHLNPSLNLRSLPLHLCLLIAAKLLGQSVYLFFHGWDDRVALAMMNGTWMGRWLRALLRSADYSSVLSERFRNQLIQAGWKPSRVQVLPLMIEVDAYWAPKSGNGPATEDNGTFNVLFLSRLARDKGIWELVDAVEWLQSNHADAPLKFTCAGDGSEYAALAAHVQDRGLTGMVHLPGYVRGEDKYAAYRDADLFVFPSYHAEGFPIAVIEALAAGLPVVYTPVGALAEILGPENGLRIEIQDVSGETVGAKIWQMYQDPDRRRLMEAANRELAARFDVGVVCRETIRVYRRVVEGK